MDIYRLNPSLVVAVLLTFFLSMAMLLTLYPLHVHLVDMKTFLSIIYLGAVVNIPVT